MKSGKRSKGAYSIEELFGKLKTPRSVWLMLPAGKPVYDMILSLKGLLKKGDTIIEGGNSFYKDDLRCSDELKPFGIKYLDVGFSGGIWGLKFGYCLMMSAYGEGFEILKQSPYGKEMDFEKIAHLWNQGSVVRSWLLELAEDAFRKDTDLAQIEGYDNHIEDTSSSISFCGMLEVRRQS